MLRTPPTTSRAALPRQLASALAPARPALPRRRTAAPPPRADVGGEYVEARAEQPLGTYHDVDAQLINYFTYKGAAKQGGAVGKRQKAKSSLRMTLAQLVETDVSPGKLEYTWLYQFALDNPPSDSKRFLGELLSQRQDMGERLLTQRQVIFRRWVKNWSPEGMDNQISDSNKSLLLQRLSVTANLSLEVDNSQRP